MLSKISTFLFHFPSRLCLAFYISYVIPFHISDFVIPLWSIQTFFWKKKWFFQFSNNVTVIIINKVLVAHHHEFSKNNTQKFFGFDFWVKTILPIPHVKLFHKNALEIQQIQKSFFFLGFISVEILSMYMNMFVNEECDKCRVEFGLFVVFPIIWYFTKLSLGIFRRRVYLFRKDPLTRFYTFKLYLMVSVVLMLFLTSKL